MMKSNKVFIIEHLESKLYPWCIIEYRHISKIIGKNNLWFTNIKSQNSKLSKYGKVLSKSVKFLNIKNACVLDPEASQLLTPKSAKSFDFFIFGGILGDSPPKKRTKAELTKWINNAKAYNIRKKQMSTDNAVYVVNKIISGIPLRQIKFKDNIEIKINKIESTLLPYRYALVNGKPFVSKELVKFLKKR